MKTTSSKIVLTLLCSLLCSSMAQAIVITFNQFSGIDGSTDQSFTEEDIDIHGDGSVLLDMTLTAVINNPDGSVDGNTFANWNGKNQDGSEVLGFNDDDDSWDEWIDSRSGDDAQGDTRFNTEEVVITFAIDGQAAMVDLGADGFEIFYHSDGGDYIVNGSTFTAPGSGNVLDTVTHFANTTDWEQLSLTPDVSAATATNDVKTALGLVSVDIADATVIPEPSAFALLLGGLGVMLITRRRRS
jgi:hypothetical protein